MHNTNTASPNSNLGAASDSVRPSQLQKLRQFCDTNNLQHSTAWNYTLKQQDTATSDELRYVNL